MSKQEGKIHLILWFQILTLLGSIQLGIKDGSIHKDINPIITTIVLSISSTGLIQNVSQYEEVLKKNFNIDQTEIIFTGFGMMTKSLNFKKIN
jgi:hypothetical protein